MRAAVSLPSERSNLPRQPLRGLHVLRCPLGVCRNVPLCPWARSSIPPAPTPQRATSNTAWLGAKVASGVVTSLWPDVAMPCQRHSSVLGCWYLRSVPWSRGKGPGSACGMGLALKPAPQGSHIHPLNANTARGVSFPEVEPHRHRWQGQARVPQRLGSPAQDPTAPALPWAGSPPPPNPPLALLPPAMASTEGAGGRRRNLALLRHKLYMGERRRTEPVVESSAAGEHGALRRSQSDRSEYSQKLQGTPGEPNWVLLAVLQAGSSLALGKGTALCARSRTQHSSPFPPKFFKAHRACGTADETLSRPRAGFGRALHNGIILLLSSRMRLQVVV